MGTAIACLAGALGVTRASRWVGPPVAGMLLLALTGSAVGHPLAPALLEIRETAPGEAEVLWRTSVLRAPGSHVQPVLPPHCQGRGDARAERRGSAVDLRWSIHCGAAGLVGSRVGIEGLGRAGIDALLRIELADGRRVQQVLRAGEPFLTVPARQRPLEVLGGYLRLGGGHILGGVDHLLFVLGLLLLIPTTRALIWTLSAFTVGHSVTLSLAALGVVAPSPGPVELAIAISVLLLALELARQARPRAGHLEGVRRRSPWALALAFGLLHGLGFAGALAELGLPQADVPLALLGFNLGIEIGQLGFVLGVLALRRLGRRGLDALPEWTRWVPIYALGSMSALWCFQRVEALLR